MKEKGKVFLLSLSLSLSLSLWLANVRTKNWIEIVMKRNSNADVI